MGENKKCPISEVCKMHKLQLHMICTGCKQLLCVECAGDHDSASHKRICCSVFKFAKENIVPGYEKQIAELDMKTVDIMKFEVRVLTVFNSSVDKNYREA